MTISTYTDLKASIKSWLRRSDMDTIIPDFVALCEADLNSRLRLSIMEDRATATISSEYAALPTGFLELRGIQLNTNPVASLSYMSPQDMDRIYGGTTGVPLFYAIVGNEFQFAPVPSSSYTAEIDYYVALDALASASTNAVLTKAPDLYLYGSLLHSAPYIQNDKRVEIWSALYEKAIKRIQIEDKVKIYSGNALVMRAG
jgi:hypothetical protein